MIVVVSRTELLENHFGAQFGNLDNDLKVFFFKKAIKYDRTIKVSYSVFNKTL